MQPANKMAAYRRKLASKTPDELVGELQRIVKDLVRLQKDVRPYEAQNRNLEHFYESALSMMSQVISALDDLSAKSSMLIEVDDVPGYPADFSLDERFYHDERHNKFYVISPSEGRGERLWNILEQEGREWVIVEDGYSLKDAIKKLEKMVGG